MPEARPGPTLTKDEARERAHAVLRERFGFQPEELTEIAATVKKRPKRGDWSFVFEDRNVKGLAQAKARIFIVIAGDEVTGADHFIFVPEDWEREQRNISGKFQIGATVRTTILVLLMLAAVAAAVVALSRGRVAVRMGLILTGVSLVGSAVDTVNDWPALVANFSTTRSYDLQRAGAALGPLLGGLMRGVTLALIAGMVARWLRPPAPSVRRVATFGVAAGWIAIGAIAIGRSLRGGTWPNWPSFGGAQTVAPWLSAAPDAVTEYLTRTVIALLVFGTIDRVTAAWSRRRMGMGFPALIIGAILLLPGSGVTVERWLGSAALLGGALLAIYVFALRQDLTVVPLVTGAMVIPGLLSASFQRQYSGAVASSVIAALSVAALAWWWFKTLRTIAARAAEPHLTSVPDESSDTPPFFPPDIPVGAPPELLPTAAGPIPDVAGPVHARPVLEVATSEIGGLPAGRGTSVPALQTENLTRDFGMMRAVDGLNLTVAAGRFYGFLGPNGAGKSTTIKMLTGLLAPTSGTMRILGEDMSDPARALVVKRRIGVVPENLALFDNLTGSEYLTFIGRMYGLAPDTVRDRRRELLAMMELAHEEDKLTVDYSHGMRKKLALAGALIPDPELLFLDEPFEGVDAVASRVLRDTLQQCVKRGATVFLTSHVLEIVERLCTDVGIIANGRLVHHGTMEELRRDGSLEERFIAVVGHERGEAQKLSWLEPG